MSKSHWVEAGYQHWQYVREDGRIVGTIWGGYRSFTATAWGQRLAEYDTLEHAKAAVENVCGGAA